MNLLYSNTDIIKIKVQNLKIFEKEIEVQFQMISELIAGSLLIPPAYLKFRIRFSYLWSAVSSEDNV